MAADPIAFWCATNLDYTWFFRIEVGRPSLQADEDTNQDRKPHRLLVCALPSYNDPARTPRCT